MESIVDFENKLVSQIESIVQVPLRSPLTTTTTITYPLTSPLALFCFLLLSCIFHIPNVVYKVRGKFGKFSLQLLSIILFSVSAFLTTALVYQAFALGLFLVGNNVINPPYLTEPISIILTAFYYLQIIRLFHCPLMARSLWDFSSSQGIQFLNRVTNAVLFWAIIYFCPVGDTVWLVISEGNLFSFQVFAFLLNPFVEGVYGTWIKYLEILRLGFDFALGLYSCIGMENSPTFPLPIAISFVCCSLIFLVNEANQIAKMSQQIDVQSSKKSPHFCN